MSKVDWLVVGVGLAATVAIGLLLWMTLVLKLEIVEQKRRVTYWQEATGRGESRSNQWEQAYRSERASYMAFVDRMTHPLVFANGQLTTSDTLEELLDPPTVSESDRVAYTHRVMEQMKEERWSPVPLVDDDAPPVQRMTDADVWDEDE